MRSKFKVRDKEYEVVLEKRERAEADKFEPYGATVTVSGQAGGAVKGTLQFTPETIAAAEKQAAGKGESVGDLLARASGRSLAAEVLIRKLKPDFSFVVDHRWLS
jgi:hypothetical protein